MKKLILTSSILFWGLLAFAQKWQKIDQSYLGCKYQLPKTASLDGFGGETWEDYGSSVCDCAGTINSFPEGSFSPLEDVIMIIYPTKHKDSLNVEKRMQVWDMKFAPTDNKTTITTTSNIKFEKQVSTWVEGTAEDNYKDNEVWRFTTKSKSQYYAIYFFATPNIMKKNSKMISEILESFIPIEVK